MSEFHEQTRPAKITGAQFAMVCQFLYGNRWADEAAAELQYNKRTIQRWAADREGLIPDFAVSALQEAFLRKEEAYRVGFVQYRRVVGLPPTRRIGDQDTEIPF